MTERRTFNTPLREPLKSHHYQSLRAIDGTMRNIFSPWTSGILKKLPLLGGM
jgi:hypothetical protein